MAVSLPHFLGLMSAPGVDHSLVDASAGTVRNERVPEDVPAANFIPTAVRKRTIKKRRSVIYGQLVLVELECKFAGRLL